MESEPIILATAQRHGPSDEAMLHASRYLR